MGFQLEGKADGGQKPGEKNEAFNASVAEVDRQEEHKMLVVGFACVSNEKSHAERMLQHILDFMEKSTEAELIWQNMVY
ncbi:MAG: DUF503 domain-containing protein [Anaerotignum faecicola]